MSPRRVSALAQRIITQFRRDRRTLVLMFAVPIIVLSLIGYLVDLKPSDVTVGVVNEDQGMVAGNILAALEDSGDFKLVYIGRNEVDEELRGGEIQGAIVFDLDFTQRLLSGQNPTMNLVLEGSDSRVMGHIRSSVTKAVPEALSQFPMMEGRLIDIQPRFIYGGADYTSLDYLGPAFVALIPFFFVFLLTSISFLRERAQGTIERLLASPLSRAETVLGYMLGFGLFSLIESLLILVFTVYVLGVHCEGNILAAILVVIIMALSAVNLGIFVSTFARNEFQAVQFVPLVVFPQGLLGGLFWSVDSLPWFLRWMSYAMPMTYANAAVREVMIKGASVVDWSVLSNLLILAGFAAVLVFFSSLTLRREVA
jgi:ABC-2 type transport system permease protein